ncbi:hypothetical protein [Clostridium botulinum]|uniref:hypothetical protein n=1 Tax=Clostridium botulinum TaxID=1491 RepID=UPI0007E1506D|nr:hypothetical protein [Clostridium botulinum]KEI81141.1 hypothetical protein N487_09620 [Clostridium botulinum B2 331]
MVIIVKTKRFLFIFVKNTRKKERKHSKLLIILMIVLYFLLILLIYLKIINIKDMVIIVRNVTNICKNL